VTRWQGWLACVTPVMMVYEIQPKLGVGPGRAVPCLLEALGLDGQDVLPL
jgi:hypothetical protein